MRKSLFVGISSLFVIMILLAGFIGFHFISTSPSNQDEEIIFEVPQGASFQRIAKELETRKLIHNATLFSWYARLKGATGKIKVGEYEMKTNMTPAQILTVITSGKSVGHPFTIAEGLNIFEIGELYEKLGYGRSKDFIDSATDKQFVKSLLGEERSSLEGYLFPETYQITKYTSARELLKAMVNRFQAVYAEIENQKEVQGLTKHQIVTLASIVEKETGAPDERPRISSVFHNRLQRGMLLQTDPTIIYGLAEQAGKTIYKISKADITRPTRYNTYVIKGLPPGPIGNPGREALLAAMKPEKTDYLFFVSQNDGTHIFTQDYKAHLAAVRRFQQDPKARKGKSWRDLQKKKAESPGAYK